MSEAVTEKIEGYIASMLESMDVELVDIQFRPEGHGHVLRLFIDTEKGVTLDLCAQVSREVGQYLDVEDAIAEAYHLEVSSPGVERPLKSLADFERFAGKKARIKLHESLDGAKSYEGMIGPVVDGKLSLSVDGGKKVVTCSFEELNKARLAL